MRIIRFQNLIWMALFASLPMYSQSINSGTVTGAVTDQSGAVISNAGVQLRNPVTGYEQSVKTDNTGTFRFNNIPQNPYRLTVAADGFAPANQEVDVRGSLPINLNVTLKLAAEITTVDVAASGASVESDPSAHQDVDRTSFLKLPTFNPGSGLTEAVTYSTGAVAADANGFFHPLGDHAQVSFVIDGQPISDQQSKMFSTQIPLNALQSMELITGSPDSQYGDKTSLIVNSTTRSGLGAAKAFGTIESQWGSFGTWGGEATLGFGGPKFGNFVALNGIRSGHFLDTPEFVPVHDRGNNESVFDRVDWQPTERDALHLNLFSARNWLQVPNRSGLPAHLQCAYLAHRQSLCAPRPVQLLRQPRPVHRHADYGGTEPFPDGLRSEGGHIVCSRKARAEVRRPDPANPALGEFSFRHHRSGIQSGVPEC